MFYVYVHRRPDSGRVFYVGKGNGDRAYRSSSRNRHWQNIVAKAGAPEVEIVARDIDEELAHLAEIELISKLRAIGCSLTNLTDGGEGVSGLKRGTPAADVIARRAASNRGRKRTAEQCRRIAEAKQGHGVGCKQPLELIEKRVAPLRGRKRPDVSLKLGGKPRPQHVVEALRGANDARYRERREKLKSAIEANPALGVMALARLTGCEREMVAKYKRLAAMES